MMLVIILFYTHPVRPHDDEPLTRSDEACARLHTEVGDLCVIGEETQRRGVGLMDEERTDTVLRASFSPPQ